MANIPTRVAKASVENDVKRTLRITDTLVLDNCSQLGDIPVSDGSKMRALSAPDQKSVLLGDSNGPKWGYVHDPRLRGKTFLFATVTFDTNGFISSVVDGNLSSGDWEPEITDLYSAWGGLTGCYGHYNQIESHVNCSFQIQAGEIISGKSELDFEITLPLLPTVDFEELSQAIGQAQVHSLSGTTDLIQLSGSIFAKVGSKKAHVRLTTTDTGGVSRDMILSCHLTYHL